MEATAHLADLFTSGKETIIVFPGKPETTVWVERPNPDQHDECMKRARADRARRYHELMGEGSDERLAFLQEVGTMNKKALVDALMERQTRQLENQAFHDVLFSPEYGSDWGTEGQDWTAVLDALQQRILEIEERNKELRAAEAEEGYIKIEDDPDITRLSEVQGKFEAEVKVRRDELVAEARETISLEPLDKLSTDLIEQRVSLECDLIWFATFKYEQLYRAVRFKDNHETLYFKNVTQIKGLPRPVQDQLFDALNEIDINTDDLKNSLTPLPSSL